MISHTEPQSTSRLADSVSGNMSASVNINNQCPDREYNEFFLTRFEAVATVKDPSRQPHQCRVAKERSLSDRWHDSLEKTEPRKL